MASGSHRNRLTPTSEIDTTRRSGAHATDDSNTLSSSSSGGEVASSRELSTPSVKRPSSARSRTSASVGPYRNANSHLDHFPSSAGPSNRSSAAASEPSSRTLSAWSNARSGSGSI